MNGMCSCTMLRVSYEYHTSSAMGCKSVQCLALPILAIDGLVILALGATLTFLTRPALVYISGLKQHVPFPNQSPS